MSATGGDADKLAGVLKHLLKAQTPAARLPASGFEGYEPACAMLVYSFLLWESTPKQAAAAYERLGASVIDLNDLRVAMPSEIAEIAGIRDGVAAERAERLRAVLNDIFGREHLVSLSRLESVSKREVREYLDALEGMPPFVAARVVLFGFGGHAVPLDRRLQQLLTGEGVLPSKLPVDEAERWLERQIRATDAVDIVLLLESWREKEKKSTPAKKKAASKGRSKKGA